MKRSILLLLLTTVALLGFAAPSQAVPRLVNYQGILTDDTGNPLDGSYALSFRIYPTQSAVDPLWMESHTTQVNNGLFNLILGSITAFPEGLFDADERWLSIQVGSDPEMNPRIRLTSVAWALRAAVADSVVGGGGGDGAWEWNGDDIYANNGGNVGIGTTTPRRLLEINGNNSEEGLRVAYGSNYNSLVGDILHGGSQGLIIHSYAGGGSWADIRFRTNSVDRMMLDHSGKLGIGTMAPAYPLDVVGTLQTEGFRMPTGATAGWVLTSDAAGQASWQPAGGATGDGDWAISGGTDLYSLPEGNVGIGITTPAAKLEVVNDGRVLRAVAEGSRPAIEGKHVASDNLAYLGSSDAAVHGISPNRAGVFAQSDSIAVVAENTSTLRTNAYLAGNYGAYGESATGNHGYLGGASFAVYGEEVMNGNYGAIGYWNYGVLGHSDSQTGVFGRSVGGTGVGGYTNTGWAVYGTHTSSGNYGYLGGSDYGLFAESENGTAVFGLSISGKAGHFMGDVLIENGDLTTPVLEITGGSDLSEGFEIAGGASGLEPAPGMLVCVDPSRPGQLMVSRGAYDTRVAGVISGAGGVQPGLLMGQKNSVASGGSPVALTGRVYCLADASTGPIAPGDLLTTSDTPGHAMKAVDRTRSHGAIIGKAMTALDSGRGLVLVLVSLQ